MELTNLTAGTMQRLTLYLKYLQDLSPVVRMVTPKMMADGVMIDPKVVRLDMKALLGKNRVNEEDRKALIHEIIKKTACQKINVVVLVGVGKLGKALMSYAGYTVYNLDILAGFDVDPKVIKKGAFGKPVYHFDRLNEICRRLNARIGVITTLGDCAQSACDALVKAGVVAIWNYSSVRLKTSPHVMVYNEDMTYSLRKLAEYAATH
nr:redox-sensing transcriptional repressor Rex [uncultured Caproiciproducens sp.]